MKNNQKNQSNQKNSQGNNRNRSEKNKQSDRFRNEKNQNCDEKSDFQQRAERAERNSRERRAAMSALFALGNQEISVFFCIVIIDIKLSLQYNIKSYNLGEVRQEEKKRKILKNRRHQHDYVNFSNTRISGCCSGATDHKHETLAESIRQPAVSDTVAGKKAG